ncbi:MAG: transglycosylase domain-containing protein [Chloroflexi bacterium]|nr:transglycosylase domain-containing protein [Chloroflexota bacterium]
MTRFELTGTLVRLWRNIMDGPIEADSSLTARLVRNVIAPQPEQATADDRGREIALVAEINRRYSPAEVLEWHLNTNYYGSEAYGIEAAAQVYLGKSARPDAGRGGAAGEHPDGGTVQPVRRRGGGTRTAG